MKKRFSWRRKQYIVLLAAAFLLFPDKMPLPFSSVRKEEAFAATGEELGKSRKEVPLVREEQQSYDNVAISRVSDYVNVRQEANTQSAVVGKIYNNCAATILATVEGEGGSWYQIQSGTVQGYIKAQYFITGDEAAKVAREVGTSYATIINATTLRLHESPSLESKTLTLLAQGARYQVIGEADGFTKLQIDTDLEGYVSSDYISITVEFKQAVSLEEEAAKAAEEEKLREEANQAIQNLEDAKRQAAEGNAASGSSVDTGIIEVNPGGDSDINSSAPPVDEGNASGTPDEGLTQPPAGSTAGSGSGTSGGNSSDGSSSEGSQSDATEVGPGGSSISSGSTGSAGVYVQDEVTTATRSAIVAYAKQFLGNPYVYGGTSLTDGADCSGFVMSIFSHFGISTGRSSRDQAANGKEIPVYSVQPGDLLFYSSGDYINHVGIYIGGGQIIHSSTPKTGITITKSNYRTPCKAVTFLN